MGFGRCIDQGFPRRRFWHTSLVWTFSLIALSACTLPEEGPLLCAPAPPRLSGPSAGDPALGCATAANLRLMLANPKDWTHGVVPGPSMAEPGAAAVRRYREDRVIPLVSNGPAPPVIIPQPAPDSNSAPR